VGPYLPKMKTRSGTTAVQIVEKRHGRRVIVEHLGSVHTDAELAALMRAGQDRLHAGQSAFESGIDPHGAPVAAVAVSAGMQTRSQRPAPHSGGASRRLRTPSSMPAQIRACCCRTGR